MNDHVLVTYASRAGSTAGIAEAIAVALRKRNIGVTIEPIKENPDVTGYQAVIIGSAIRQGKWLPEALKFLKVNQAALMRKRVALFTVHMLNRSDDAVCRQRREAYLDDLRPLVLPVAHDFFPGKIDPQSLSLIDRLLLRTLPAPQGDFRDWDKIDSWTQELVTDQMNA